jgi:nonsense-mediated mRNA decay protein 3
LLHFIESNFIARSKHSQQLVSHDPRANTAMQKYTSICELAPICRDDLVILPKALSKSLGGIGPLVLVYKVTQFVHIVDIHTMRTHEIAS